MKLLKSLSALLLLVVGCASTGDAAESNGAKVVEAAAYAPMEIFAPLAGRTFKGDGTGPGGEPIIDIVNYEFILGGRAFQATHKLKDSAYGGRTIFFFDEGAKKYIFHYFTTAGFHTTGEVEPTETGFTASESVAGHESIVEVRSEIIIDGDVIRVAANYIDKNGDTAEGGERVYQPVEHAILFFDAADAAIGAASE
ncbi:MAG: hypothetical protein HKP25_04650 [Marinicaulis sp.]|nr:hypothetical protein [Marinicaulis sp.]